MNTHIQQSRCEDRPARRPARAVRFRAASSRAICTAAAVLGVWTGGCIDFTNDTLQTALTGPYVVAGVMEVDDEIRACSLFREDSGVTYILFQGTRMTNADYDSIFVDGARVRLEINRRSGLLTNCDGGTIAEVQEVYELILPDGG